MTENVRRDFITPDVIVWIHPINVNEHPSYRPGYRWAVHAGGNAPSDLRFCCNAGREDSLQDAQMVGESHGVAACKASRIFGVPTRYFVRVIDWDPIPASADMTPHEIWNEGRSNESYQ